MARQPAAAGAEASDSVRSERLVVGGVTIRQWRWRSGFAPGLRIAIAGACAYAEVRPLKLSVLNAIASLIWAVLMLSMVAYLGPAMLQRLGISGWWGALVPAVLILAAEILLRAKPAVEARS